MTDYTQFTEREQYRYEVIIRLIQGKLVNDQAAQMLGVSSRQVTRIRKAVQHTGVEGIIHKLKNRPSNHRIAPVMKQKVLETIKTRYYDFKPGFATEKLQERHGIAVTSQTIRMWMSVEGLWKMHAHKKRGMYRSWRPRKDHCGEMEQFDGSYHLWFEDRYKDDTGSSIEVCLLASIDDATGKITRAEFAPHEGVIPVFQFWKSYVCISGKPQSIYLDKFSTYKINHKSAVDNHELMTQFQRLVANLHITLITAHSPQAKGRIERLFSTLQDRLVKEMRLAQISTPQEGNIFLRNIFIPHFNKKFSVVPEKTGDMHIALTDTDTKYFNRIFSIQSSRKVNNDFTIQFKNRWYQLAEIQPTTVRAKETVLIEEWLDHTVHISLREQYLSYVMLPTRPEKIKTPPTILTTHRLNWKPPMNHPWRKYRSYRG